MTTILVVDDEEPIQELLRFNLEKEGYLVSVAKDGQEALKQVETNQPDLLVLDLMLPGMDGLEVCRKLRSNPKFQQIPIIMLTAKGEEIDKVLGLELGADDYMTKPFSPRELLARIKARLRRPNSQVEVDTQLITRGELQVDVKGFRVHVRGEETELPPKNLNFYAFWLLIRDGYILGKSCWNEFGGMNMMGILERLMFMYAICV